jgi:hypothetical protein
MADTKHTHAIPAAPIEGDGISYRGILWFVVVLAVTTVVCQALMWGLLEFFLTRANSTDQARAPMVAPVAVPAIQNDNMVAASGGEMPPPYLQTREPLGLERFREREDAILTTYGWVDQNNGIVRIPIERAKALLLERGIPGGSPMATAAPPAPPVKIGKD